jgi:SAM-dependent methyltransferase
MLCTMNDSVTPWLDPRIAGRIVAAADLMLESHWRECAGLALRLGSDTAGVIERPGRTRFEMAVRNGQIVAPLRAELPNLPFDDAAFAFVALDRIEVEDEHWPQLIQECARVLAGNGRLLIVNVNPFGWVGCLDRFSGRMLAPPMGRLRRQLHASDLIDVRCERRLCWPPLPATLIDSIGDGLDIVGQRFWSTWASLYGLSARREESNVIRIPIGRARPRAAAVTAPGLRRAG